MSTYVIAEIGINHNGSLDLAKRLIDAAKEAGCDAVKFQKRTIDLVYTEKELAAPRESPFGKTNGELKRGLEFGRDSYGEIDAHCKRVGIAWSASAWDVESVKFLSSFSPPWLKIPSALITNKELVLEYVRTGIPLIISTGMSTWEEIDQVMAWTVDNPVWPTLLHCHSSYPSPLEEINLACINSFKERYPGVKVGYSSHTVSPWPCLMAVVYGAEVVEAHLTLDRSEFTILPNGTKWQGSDHSASLEPGAFKKLVTEIRTWEKCKGDGIKRVYPSEIPVREKLRR
jgi:N-acetylneuraminate synthase